MSETINIDIPNKPSVPRTYRQIVLSYPTTVMRLQLYSEDADALVAAIRARSTLDHEFIAPDGANIMVRDLDKVLGRSMSPVMASMESAPVSSGNYPGTLDHIFG